MQIMASSASLNDCRQYLISYNNHTSPEIREHTYFSNMADLCIECIRKGELIVDRHGMYETDVNKRYESSYMGALSEMHACIILSSMPKVASVTFDSSSAVQTTGVDIFATYIDGMRYKVSVKTASLSSGLPKMHLWPQVVSTLLDDDTSDMVMFVDNLSKQYLKVSNKDMRERITSLQPILITKYGRMPIDLTELKGGAIVKKFPFVDPPHPLYTPE